MLMNAYLSKLEEGPFEGKFIEHGTKYQSCDNLRRFSSRMVD